MGNEKKISLKPLKFEEAIADILKGETIREDAAETEEEKTKPAKKAG